MHHAGLLEVLSEIQPIPRSTIHLPSAISHSPSTIDPRFTFFTLSVRHLSYSRDSHIIQSNPIPAPHSIQGQTSPSNRKPSTVNRQLSAQGQAVIVLVLKILLSSSTSTSFQLPR